MGKYRYRVWQHREGGWDYCYEVQEKNAKGYFVGVSEGIVGSEQAAIESAVGVIAGMREEDAARSRKLGAKWTET